MEYFQEFQQNVKEEYHDFIEEIKSNLTSLPEDYKEDVDSLLNELPELEKVYEDFANIENVTVQDAKSYKDKVFEAPFMAHMSNFLSTLPAELQQNMSVDAVRKMTASVTALNVMLLVNGELN